MCVYMSICACVYLCETDCMHQGVWAVHAADVLFVLGMLQKRFVMCFVVCWNARENYGENKTLSRVRSAAKRKCEKIDKLDEARTNANDRMMLARQRSGDRVMS